MDNILYIYTLMRKYMDNKERGGEQSVENIIPWVSLKGTTTQISTAMESELKYKKNEEKVREYIDNLPEEEKQLVGKFLYIDSKDLVNRLKDDDEIIRDFFKFVEFLFTQNEAYWDKNYVLMIEKSIFDKIEDSQNLSQKDLEFIKSVFNNNLQFFHKFFSERMFMSDNPADQKKIIQDIIDGKLLTPFNISQIQKILRWNAFSFTSWQWKIRIESFQKIEKKREEAVKDFLEEWKDISWFFWWKWWKKNRLIGLLGKNPKEFIHLLAWKKWNSTQDDPIHLYSLHVTPNVNIQKDSKNILLNLKKLHELMPDIFPYILLDSWLLDVDYEKFCENYKRDLKQTLKNECNENKKVREIINDMENSKSDMENLENLCYVLKSEFELCINKLEIDFQEGNMELTNKENADSISTRLTPIKEHIVMSYTYKLKDTDKFKEESEFNRERKNIIKNNTAEARYHVKENVVEWNINWVVTWVSNLVIQEYLLKKYEENFWLWHGRVIVSLDEVK